MRGQIRITAHLKCVTAGLKARSKKKVLEELVSLLIKSGEELNKRDMVKALMERESIGSTGIGKGIAIPHAKIKSVTSPLIAFGRSVEGVEFGSADKKEVHLFFLILSPSGDSSHLRILARVTRFMNESSFRNRLKAVDTEEEILKIIRERDER